MPTSERGEEIGEKFSAPIHPAKRVEGTSIAPVLCACAPIHADEW